MEFINKGQRKWMKGVDYNGVCDNCGVVLTSSKELFILVLRETDTYIVGFPDSELECPQCKTPKYFLILFKSLEVTNEFNLLAHAR